jgi:hypothetical protein
MESQLPNSNFKKESMMGTADGFIARIQCAALAIRFVGTPAIPAPFGESRNASALWIE